MPDRGRSVSPLTIVVAGLAVATVGAIVAGAAVDASSTTMAIVFAVIIVAGGVAAALVARRAMADRWRHLGVDEVHRDAVTAALRTGVPPTDPVARAQAVRAAATERARTTRTSWTAAGFMGVAGVLQLAGDAGGRWFRAAGFLAAAALMALSAWTSGRRYDRLIAAGDTGEQPTDSR